MPPKMPKSSFCLAYALHFCSKTNRNLYSLYAFLECTHTEKTVCFRACALATGFSPRSPPLFSAFGLNFWPLGASLPFVTPISGYAYVRVRVSNNKQ